MTLTAADGSMRTQTGVRLAISPVPGAPDRAVSMSAPIQARMSALRACFSAAMQRATGSAGRAEFDIEADGAKARVKLTLDETGDRRLIACMGKALARTQFTSVPRGSRVRVGLFLSNPLAAVQKQRAEAAAEAHGVRMLAGGRAETESETVAGDIKVRLSGSAYAAVTMARLQQDITSQFAGLLDCRRKASRRERDSSYSVAVDLSVRDGTLAHGTPRSSMRRATPQCVTAWLERLDAKRLEDADLELAISFVR